MAHRACTPHRGVSLVVCAYCGRQSSAIIGSRGDIAITPGMEVSHSQALAEGESPLQEHGNETRNGGVSFPGSCRGGVSSARTWE